ncbi:RRXRR domain-containing protein [Microbacteriaceae bacterium 4G12]
MNLRGKFFTPCSPRKAWLLLKEGKAKVVSHTPFTIQFQKNI